MTQTRSFSLPEKTIERLEEHTEQTGLKASTVVAMALNLFFAGLDITKAPARETPAPQGKE